MSNTTRPEQGCALTGFKNSIGAYIVKPLFFEFDTAEHLFSVYSLKHEDHTFSGVVYPSLRRLFVELEDPTEYIFATTYLAGWPHWKRLQESPALQPFIEEWREELDVRMRSKALVRIHKRAQSESKDSLTADKILLSGGWRDDKSPVGRPTKERIKQEAERLFTQSSDVDDDFNRIFPSLN